MSNYITTLVKERYPEFADIPDDELTLKYAKDYPDQLKNPEFKADYIRIKSASKTPEPRMQTVAESLLDLSSWGRSAGDLVGGLAKGGVALGEGLVGMADIPSLGWAGYGLEKGLGYDPRYLNKLATDNLQSEEMRRQLGNVEAAKGFTGTAKALIQNPLALTDTLLESGPSMFGGQAITKGLLKSAPAMNKLVALGAGEGAITAGSTAESIRQQNPSGLITPEQAALSVLAGGATGLVTAGSGGLTKRIGLDDVDALLLDGQRVSVPRHIGVRLPVGAAAEGSEELLQSTQEAILQNIALGKPWDEGVGKQAATGFVSGAAMGGGMNVPGGINPSAAIDRVNAQLEAVEKARASRGGGNDAVRSIATEALEQQAAEIERRRTASQEKNRSAATPAAYAEARRKEIEEAAIALVEAENQADEAPFDLAADAIDAREIAKQQFLEMAQVYGIPESEIETLYWRARSQVTATQTGRPAPAAKAEAEGAIPAGIPDGSTPQKYLALSRFDRAVYTNWRMANSQKSPVVSPELVPAEVTPPGTPAPLETGTTPAAVTPEDLETELELERELADEADADLREQLKLEAESDSKLAAASAAEDALADQLGLEAESNPEPSDPFLDGLDYAEKRLQRVGLRAGRGNLYEGIISAPVWISKDAAIALIQVIRVSYKVSKSVVKSASVAIDWLRKQNIQGFNDAEASSYIQELLKGSSANPNTPTTTTTATPTRGDIEAQSFRIVPSGQGDFDGMRAGYGKATILNTKPGNPGWLGNPDIANDVRGGTLTREQAVDKFKATFLSKIKNDTEFRDAVLALRGKSVGYYKPSELNHLNVVQDWLAAQPASVAATPAVARGENIASKARGGSLLGQALTNVTFGKMWEITQPDMVELLLMAGLIKPTGGQSAEHWYQRNKSSQDDPDDNDPEQDHRDLNVMSHIIEAKLRQYPELAEAITSKGGVAWLKASEHTVFPSPRRRPSGFSWEGKGDESGFIRSLITAYDSVINRNVNWRMTGGIFGQEQRGTNYRTEADLDAEAEWGMAEEQRKAEAKPTTAAQPVTQKSTSVKVISGRYGVVVAKTNPTPEFDQQLADAIFEDVRDNAYPENRSATAQRMWGNGYMWKGNLTKKPTGVPLEVIPAQVDINANGKLTTVNTPYFYDPLYNDGVPVAPIGNLDFLKRHMEKALGIDMSDYDVSLNNIYESGQSLQRHTDIDESNTAKNYPVIVYVFGNDHTVRFDDNEGKRTLGPMVNPITLALKNGDIYTLGVDGRGRFEALHDVQSSEKTNGNFPELVGINGKLTRKYTVSFTFRRAADLTPGMPKAPAIISTHAATPAPPSAASSAPAPIRATVRPVPAPIRATVRPVPSPIRVAEIASRRLFYDLLQDRSLKDIEVAMDTLTKKAESIPETVPPSLRRELTDNPARRLAVDSALKDIRFELNQYFMYRLPKNEAGDDLASAVKNAPREYPESDRLRSRKYILDRMAYLKHQVTHISRGMLAIKERGTKANPKVPSGFALQFFLNDFLNRYFRRAGGNTWSVYRGLMLERGVVLPEEFEAPKDRLLPSPPLSPISEHKPVNPALASDAASQATPDSGYASRIHVIFMGEYDALARASGGVVTTKKLQNKLAKQAWIRTVKRFRKQVQNPQQKDYAKNLPKDFPPGILALVPLNPRKERKVEGDQGVDDGSLDTISLALEERLKVITVLRDLYEKRTGLRPQPRAAKSPELKKLDEDIRLGQLRLLSISAALVRNSVGQFRDRIDPEGSVYLDEADESAEGESIVRDSLENEKEGRVSEDLFSWDEQVGASLGQSDVLQIPMTNENGSVLLDGDGQQILVTAFVRQPGVRRVSQVAGESADGLDGKLSDKRKGVERLYSLDSNSLARILHAVKGHAYNLYVMDPSGEWLTPEPDRVVLGLNIENILNRFNPISRRLKERKTPDDSKRDYDLEREALAFDRLSASYDMEEAVSAVYAEYSKQTIEDYSEVASDSQKSVADLVLMDGYESFLKWFRSNIVQLKSNGYTETASRMEQFFKKDNAFAPSPLLFPQNVERAKTAHLLSFLYSSWEDGSEVHQLMFDRAQLRLSQDFENSEKVDLQGQVVARYSLAAPTADGITPVPNDPSLALFLRGEFARSGITLSASRLVIDHLPNHPHIEGWYDPDGTIHLNSSAPSMKDPANVQRVIREEFKHSILNTPQGRERIRRIFGKLTRSDIALLQKDYRQGHRESLDDYLNRLADEFIAKHSRLKTGLWSNLTLRIKNLLEGLGVRDMTLAESADAIHLALNLDGFGGSSGRLTLKSMAGGSGRLSRMLTPTSGLGAKLKNIVDLGYSNIDTVKRNALSAQKRLGSAILEDFGVPYEDLPDKDKVEILRYLKESSDSTTSPIFTRGGFATATMDELKSVRKEITKLSEKYYYLAAPFLEKSILDTIRDNDSYLTRSYQMFSDPNWVDDLKQKIEAGTDPKLTAAFDAAILDLQRDSVNPLTREDAALEVYRKLHDLSDTASLAGASSSLADMHGATVKRESISASMKVLMGEVTDPAVVLGVTIGSLQSKIVYYETMNAFVGQALEDGLISPSSDNNPDHLHSMQLLSGTDPFSAFKTTKGFLLHVQELRQKQKESSALLDFIAAVSRATKVYQVAGNLGFVAQQFFGNPISLIQMGHFTSALSLPSGTIKVLRDRFGKSSEADFAEFTKLASYGLLNDNQMTPLVKARIADCVMGIPLYEQLNTINKFRGGVDNFLQMLASVDTAAKIIAFYAEVAAITEAYADAPPAERLSADQINQAASARVRERMPSISRTPLALRHLDYIPFLGQFTIFAYLSSYNLVKNIQYTLLDLKNPRMRANGLKSLAGIAASAAISGGLLKAALQAILGAVTPDEEKEFMDGRKAWDKEKRYVIYKGSDRKIRGFSLDSLDPMSNMAKAFSSLYKGVATEASFVDSVVSAVGQVLSPLLQEGKITKVWGDILEGEDSLNRRIWNDSDGGLDKLSKSLLHVGKNLFTPASIRKFIDEIGPVAIKGERPGGRPSTLTMLVVGELTATHPEYLSREGAIRRQMRDLLATNRRLGTDSTRGLLSRSKETQADVDKRYDQFLKDRRLAFDKASTSIRRLAKGGRFAEGRLFELGKESDLSFASVRALLTGEQADYRLSLETQDDIRQLNAMRDFTNPLPTNLKKQFRAVDRSTPRNLYSPIKTQSEREHNLYQKMNN